MFDELQRASVKLLGDVRAIASSHRPGFSKTQLAARLDERGIGYIHLRCLGTPKDDCEATHGGDMKALSKIYHAHLKTPQARAEMDEPAALVRKAGPVCILCYEHDHNACHRKFVAEIIGRREGISTENLIAPQI